MQAIMRCTALHVDALSGMLARAFFNDPLYQYILPDVQTRLAPTIWDMGCLLRYGLHFGQVFATAGLEGCAVWLPPGETDFTEERQEAVGMLEAAAHIGAEGEARYNLFVEASEIFHRQLAPQPHWYLLLLGVEPARQGSGLGSALLEAVFPVIDAGGYSLYLETTHPNNLPFYQRHGFTLRAQAPLTPQGVEVWYLVREPVTGMRNHP